MDRFASSEIENLWDLEHVIEGGEQLRLILRNVISMCIIINRGSITCYLEATTSL